MFLKKLGSSSKRVFQLVAAVAFGLTATESFAIGGSTIGEMANNLNSSLNGVVNLVQGVAYTSGFVLGITALFQFKAHKDNPQQTPLSKPIVAIFLSALMLYLPSLIDSGAKSVWGGSSSPTMATKPGGGSGIGGIIPGLQ